MSLILSTINGEKKEYKWEDEFRFNVKDIKNEDEFSSLNNGNQSLLCFENQQEVVELHGQKIILGYRAIEIEQPFYKIKDSVLILKSKSKKVKIWHSKELF